MDFVFPFEELPYPAYRNVLKHLSMKDTLALMLASKETHYRIAKMLPATGKWKVPLTQTSYESNFKTLKKAKDRQDVRPRNLEIKLEITYCSYLKDTRWTEGEDEYFGDPRDCGLGFDCLEMKKTVIQDWSQQITALKLELLGNEAFLADVTCPNLESLAYEMYPKQLKPSCVDIIHSFTTRHADVLKSLGIIGDERNATLFQLPTHMPLLEDCKLTCVTSDNMTNIVNIAHKTLVALEVEWGLDDDGVIQLNNRPEKLEHLLIYHRRGNLSPVFGNLIKSVAPQLVTLKMDCRAEWMDDYFLESCPNFSKVQLLWVFVGFNLRYLRKFMKLEHLFCLSDIGGGFGSRSDALKLPKLTTLVVESFDEWSLEMIKLNAETLEVIMVLSPEGYEFVTCQLPRLKHFFLMEGELDGVEHIKTKCPPSCQVIPEQGLAYNLMMGNSKSYPYPNVSNRFEDYMIFDVFDEEYFNDDFY